MTRNTERTYEIWFSWDASEAAMTTQDAGTAFEEFGQMIKRAEGMPIELRSNGKVIAAFPTYVEDEDEEEYRSPDGIVCTEEEAAEADFQRFQQLGERIAASLDEESDYEERRLFQGSC